MSDSNTRHEMLTIISESQDLLEIHRKSFQSVVNGGILVDHFMSLKHGLQFLQLFTQISANENLMDGMEHLVPHVKQKLYFLSHLREDESLFMKLDHEYYVLREAMRDVIIDPWTNKHHEIFPESFRYYACKRASSLLCEIIEDLLSSHCKADQIRPVMKELENIKNMLSLLKPFVQYKKPAKHFVYEEPWDKAFAEHEKKKKIFAEHEKEKKILSTVAAVMERVACFVYLSAVGKMDDEMVISLKDISSDLIIEETQIMEMYLRLDVDSIQKLESHISMSLRLLGWNKRCYLGTELGEPLEDHFTSIQHGLQYLVKILKVSKNEDLKLRVAHLIKIVKQKLYSLPHNQHDENLKVNLERAYGELREEMKYVVIKPGTDDYDTLFPKSLFYPHCLRLKEIMELTSLKLTSSSKADHIAPIMKEIKELRKKLRSLKPLFNYAENEFLDFSSKYECSKVNAALTAFLDRAICLIYLSMVAKLNEDMFVSLRKNFSLLIEETEIEKLSLDLGIIFQDELESDIDISLSLMKIHQEYNIPIGEAMLEDHIISLKHGIEFLKLFSNFYKFDKDLKRCIILLAGNVKQKLEGLTVKQEDESPNMDVNDAYADLRKEMKNVIISQIADKYDSLFPKFNSYYGPGLEKFMKDYHRGNYDFLDEKITTLVTANCKASQIAPLKKELEDLRKRLKIFKPLGLYICEIPEWSAKTQILKTLLTFLQKATFLIYLAFVGTMDIQMVLSVKSSISIAMKETDDVQKIYTLILNQFLSEGHYEVKELYLLKNMMILLENNGESLGEENFRLHEVLIDLHSFLLDVPRNVILRKLHLLNDILCHSIPIVYSCYLEPTEVDISAEVNCLLDLIKHVKSEPLEMKLYYFPRVDDLGFLEFLLGYLEDLMKNRHFLGQRIRLKGACPDIVGTGTSQLVLSDLFRSRLLGQRDCPEEIDALHIEVNTLLSLAKKTNQEELDKNPWNDIMNLAYQAEYIIDLYLVSSSRDLGLISSLSKVIEQLHNIRADVTWDLSHLCRSLPAQDVAAETSKPQVIGLTTQVGDNDGIVGLHEETKNIMDDLLKGENKLNVVAIIGMAGVGKTSLALTLYNTRSTIHHFDIRARCVVSQSYQLRALLVSILDQVNADKSHTSISDNEELADHFCRHLKKRRYLILLDDLWDITLWNYLRRYLPDNLNGSRILITSRNRDVADQIGSQVNELQLLSEKNCWELFQKKMLQIECLSEDLLTISKGIVKNCQGLPLSIVIVAAILSGIERTEEKWNQIAKSVNSVVLSEPQGNCRALLELSYNNLPNHLRSCFLYLGSFPEDEEISVNRLILLWIGEGFVQDTEKDTAEGVAKKYVDDLIVKSLVIPEKKRSEGGVKTFRLHDLLRDFCLGKAKEKHFLTLLGSEAFDEINHSLGLQDPRRIIMTYYMPRKMVDFSCHSVRSMICHGLFDAFDEERIKSNNMVLLRVLEVDEVCSDDDKFDFSYQTVCSEQLKDISSLVHLRYLSFCFENAKNSFLPSTISRLQNLQILILRFSDFKAPDIKVADFIWDMVKLRHIHIYEASFEVDSNRLQNSSVLLADLKSLSKARVSYGDSEWLSRLSGLQRLHCLFMRDVKDNQSRMLSFNETLISLNVQDRTGSMPRFVSTCQLPKSLRKLTFSNFYLESNDFSIIGQSLTHLEVFKISFCSVPSGSEWNVEDEVFQELKVLKFRYLNISKWIASENSFPSLEQLFVEKCDSLDEIPLEFGSLPKLLIISVKDCPPSVDNSAREIEKVQHEEQNTEMRVHISQRPKARGRWQ